MINIGQYIETAINWLTNHFATFFDTLSIGNSLLALNYKFIPIKQVMCFKGI